MVGSAANCHQLQRHWTKKESANQRHTTFFLFFFLLCLFVACCVCCGEHGTGCAWTGWACLGTGSIPCACLQVCDRRHSTVTICPLVGLLSSRSVCVCVCLRVCVCCGYLSLLPPPWSAPCLAEKQQSLFHSDLLFIQESMPFFSAETHIITGSATAAAC